MKKIFISILALVLTVGAVSGAAYAFFSDKVTVSGITLSTGDAHLKIKPSNAGDDSFGNNLDLLGSIVDEEIYPGYGMDNSVFAAFSLKNKSDADIALSVTGQLTSATEDPAGSWNLLKDVVQVAVNTSDDLLSSGWYSLADWNTGAIAFPGPVLDQDDTQDYKVYLRVLITAGNEIALTGLNNITFDLVGTQVP